MQITVTDRPPVKIAAVAGRFDSTTAEEAQQLLMGLIDDGCRLLVIDFTDVTYLSSYGLRVLLILVKRLKVLHGALALSGVPPQIHKILETSGFTDYFCIYAQREDAVAAVTVFGKSNKIQ